MSQENGSQRCRNGFSSSGVSAPSLAVYADPGWKHRGRKGLGGSLSNSGTSQGAHKGWLSRNHGYLGFAHAQSTVAHEASGRTEGLSEKAEENNSPHFHKAALKAHEQAEVEHRRAASEYAKAGARDLYEEHTRIANLHAQKAAAHAQTLATPNLALKVSNAKRPPAKTDSDGDRHGGVDWSGIGDGHIRPGTDVDCGEGVTLHRHSNGSYRLSEPSKIPGRRAHHLISHEHAKRLIKNLRGSGRLRNSAHKPSKERDAWHYHMLTEHVKRTTRQGKVPHPDILKAIEGIKARYHGFPPKHSNDARDRAEITGSFYNYNYGLSSETEKPYNFLTDPGQAAAMPNKDLGHNTEEFKKMKAAMLEQYGEEKGTQVAYAKWNKYRSQGKIPWHIKDSRSHVQFQKNKDVHTCTACGGTGFKDRTSCPACGGTGELNTTGKEHKLPKQDSDTAQYLRTRPMTNRLSNQLVSTPEARRPDPPSEMYSKVDGDIAPNAPNYPNAGTSMQSDAPAGSGLGNMKCDKHGIENCNSCGCGDPDKKHVHEFSPSATLPKMANDDQRDNSAVLAAERVASTEQSGRENDADKNIAKAREMFAGADPQVRRKAITACAKHGVIDCKECDGMHNAKTGKCEMHGIENCNVCNCTNAAEKARKACAAHGVMDCNICNESADGEMGDGSPMGNSMIGSLSPSPMIGGHMPNKVLTAKARSHISKKNFALPGGRYPIHDQSHARNALARVSQFGTSSEKARVRAAVHKKYPGIGNREEPDRDEVLAGVIAQYPGISNRAAEMAADLICNAGGPKHTILNSLQEHLHRHGYVPMKSGHTYLHVSPENPGGYGLKAHAEHVHSVIMKHPDFDSDGKRDIKHSPTHSEIHVHHMPSGHRFGVRVMRHSSMNNDY